MTNYDVFIIILLLVLVAGEIAILVMLTVKRDAEQVIVEEPIGGFGVNTQVPNGVNAMLPSSPTTDACLIIRTSDKSYIGRRPHNHPDVKTAINTPGLEVVYADGTIEQGIQ